MPSAPAGRPTSRARRPLPTVSVVIPVRDSVGLPPMLRSLAWGVRRVADEVVMVTAGPAEDAAVLAACPEALLVRPARPGLGNALACGFAAATGDVVVALDAGGATDPGELPRYVEALVAGADVALGSRYREGGQDLTAGRFRRRLNLTLIWWVNVLFRVHRTDPGFGYTALWRDVVDRLGLPDTSPAAPAAWGDGPEIQALITVRTAARGLAVTEVPGVAYPRMRRAARADRTTLRHWLRALAGEFRGRTRHPARHAVPPVARTAVLPPAGSVAVRSRGAGGPTPGTSTAPMVPPTPRRTGAGTDRLLWGLARGGHGPAGRRPADLAAPLDRMTGPARPAGPPAGTPVPPGAGTPVPPRAGTPVPPRAGTPVPPRGGTPVPPRGGTPVPPRAGTPVPPGAGIPVPPAEQPRREVGTKRRRLEAYRERPELRVIEGDGTGSGRTRGGRLRAVPQE